MRAILLAPLLPLVSLLGCMGSAAGADEAMSADDGLSIEAESLEDGEVIALHLRNDGDEVVQIGCEERYCFEPRMLRIQAQQADGSFVDRAPNLGYVPDRDRRREVWPERVEHLADARITEPGVYRVIARVDTPNGPVVVRRELALVGWSREVAGRAFGLIDRADEAACGGLSDTLRDSAIRRVEADEALVLLDRTDDEHGRFRLYEAMLERGSFVPELSEEVRAMSMEGVRRFAQDLERYPDDVQVPLRREVALRLAEPVSDLNAPLDEDLLRLLESFNDSWPVDTPDAFVIRLAQGTDEGDLLAMIIDVITYAPAGLFDPDAGRIVAALDARCEGAADLSALRDSCDRARDRFTLEGIGFGRGWGSSRCGGFFFVSDGVCAEIRDDFFSLSEEAGAPELVVLGGEVEPFRGDDV